jgi:hypothetical protein
MQETEYHWLSDKQGTERQVLHDLIDTANLKN